MRSSAMLSNAMVTCSPVESSTSISRGLGPLMDRLGERDKTVGLAGHGGDDDHDLIAPVTPCLDPLRDGVDPLDAADRRAAVFLYYQRHTNTCGVRLKGPRAQGQGA